MSPLNKYQRLLVALLAGMLPACNSIPDIDLPEPDSRIVVDGWIEEGDQAKVLLTTNSPYFASIDSASLRDLVLTRAKVTLDDGEQSEVLILRKDETYFPPYYYEGNRIFGKAGRTYTLTAEYGGKIIRSETTIPKPVAIDTAWFQLLENEDSLGYLRMEFTDPPDEKNYYRIFTQRLGLDNKFIPSFIMAINDQYFNGKSIRLSLFRAPETYLSTKDDNFFRPGETILVKLSTMNKATFEFWSSYQDEILNSTNPFASSLYEVRSNIEGDGLGIWGGYGIHIDTVYAAIQ
jgi:hypothetical protein